VVVSLGNPWRDGFLRFTNHVIVVSIGNAAITPVIQPVHPPWRNRQGNALAQEVRPPVELRGCHRLLRTHLGLRGF
jgi:hypothetical protein